jgi:hypothetical protein
MILSLRVSTSVQRPREVQAILLLICAALKALQRQKAWRRTGRC